MTSDVSSPNRATFCLSLTLSASPTLKRKSSGTKEGRVERGKGDVSAHRFSKKSLFSAPRLFYSKRTLDRSPRTESALQVLLLCHLCESSHEKIAKSVEREDVRQNEKRGNGSNLKFRLPIMSLFSPFTIAPLEQQEAVELAAACWASWHESCGFVQVEPALTRPAPARSTETVLRKVEESILEELKKERAETEVLVRGKENKMVDLLLLYLLESLTYQRSLLGCKFSAACFTERCPLLPLRGFSG